MLSVHGVLLQVDKANVGRIVSRIQMAVTTAVEDVNLKTTCRVCLVKQNPTDLFCLFGLNKMFEDLSIASAILECFNVELKEDEKLPKYVCIKCASNTLQSYTFKKCLKKCQGYLQELVQRNLNEINKENVLEVTQNMPPEENCNSATMCTTLEHSYTLQLSDDVIENSSAVNLIHDHDYCKVESHKKSPRHKVKQNKQKEEEENLQIKENGCENDTELKTINSPEVVEKTVKKKEKQGKKVNNDPSRWWCKNAGPPYECKICGRGYGVRFRPFYMHARSHYIKKHTCQQCGKVFSRDKLKIHMRIHTKERPYACDRCPKRFAVLGNLTRHLMCHTGEKRFICDICGKAFTQSTSLHNHKQAHAGQTLFVCVYCGKTFSSDASHRSHVHSNHKTKSDNSSDILEKTYSCDICGKGFRKAGYLHIHSRIHTDNKRYHCKICFKKFTSQLNYQIHTFWHELVTPDDTILENQDWSCEFCTEVFTERKALTHHVLTHMARTFKCHICEKSYVSKRVLGQHLRQHTDEKPFSCITCHKTFRYVATLKQHLRIHTGEKPYKCQVCSRMFAQHQQLISHSFTHTGEKRYVCSYCGKAFALNGNLTVHKRRHTGETPYVCDFCGKGFYDSSSMKKHKAFHNIKDVDAKETILKDALDFITATNAGVNDY